MNFRTELHLTPSDRKLTVASNVVTVGSCFSEVIGKQLEKYKVNTLTNPFGTIFNPLSACKLLQACCGIDIELANAFVQRDGRWYSYDFHSSFSAETEEALYELLDEVVVKTRRFLKQADLLILTLGTANVFRLNITGETVANCHKMPANNFEKETLNPEEIIAAVAETQSVLRELNPNLRMVISVSPVRHIKDTLELNSVSKSVLRLATHYITQQIPEIFYFPAYELLLDDLRDYRFYKPDMLHPSDMAEQYIWQKFNRAYFDEGFREFTADWDKVLKAMEHKPFQLATEAHQNFVQTMLQKLETLKSSVNTDSEMSFFQSQVRELPKPVEPEEEDKTDNEKAENEVGKAVVIEEDLDDLPEIDDEIIESKYPAKKHKKAPKLPKRDLFKTDLAQEKPAVAITEPEAEPVLNETPEERKRRKKKERRKKKKTTPNAGSENLQMLPASSETPDAPFTSPTPVLTPETPSEAVLPAGSVSDKKPKKGKKGKLQQASPIAESTENQELFLQNEAVNQADTSTEAPDQNSRPIMFSKFYLDRLAREKAETEADNANPSTEVAANQANAEAPSLPETEALLPVAVAGTGQPAMVTDAPIKKRGGRPKKQTPAEKPVEQTTSPEISEPLPAQPFWENVSDLPSKPENQHISESQEIQPNKQKQKGKAPKKGSNKTKESAKFLPESGGASADVTPVPEPEIRPIPETGTDKPSRPIKAAKVRAPKNPVIETEIQPELPAVVQAPESQEEIKPEPAKTVAISGKNKKSKPAKASKTVKPGATELPLFPETAAVVSPELPVQTNTNSGDSSPKKHKPSGAKAKQLAKPKKGIEPTEPTKAKQTAKPKRTEAEPSELVKPAKTTRKPAAEKAEKTAKTTKPKPAKLKPADNIAKPAKKETGKPKKAGAKQPK